MSELDLKIEAQKKYCKLNGLPNFAGNGVFFSCNKNVFQNMTIEQSGKDLITGCPHCNKSFCD
jgi:hypothetical protein